MSDELDLDEVKEMNATAHEFFANAVREILRALRAQKKDPAVSALVLLNQSCVMAASFAAMAGLDRSSLDDLITDSWGKAALVAADMRRQKPAERLDS